MGSLGPQIHFFKQQYITVNATIPGQDRIHLKTQGCRTLFLLQVFLSENVIACFDAHEQNKTGKKVQIK